MIMMNTVLKNPVTLWLKWVMSKLYFERKYAHAHLQIRYMAKFSDCKFGNYNTLYDDAALADVVLGDFTYVAYRSRLSRITLGKFCCVGPDVLAGMGRHPSRDFVSIHPAFYSTKKQAQITFCTHSVFKEFERITVGNDVWIGARAVIVDGVTIGNGAIVGAGAVVNKDVPPYAVVGGGPAQVFRYRFTPEEIAFLEDFRWWDRDIDWLKANVAIFHDIKQFVSNARN